MTLTKKLNWTIVLSLLTKIISPYPNLPNLDHSLIYSEEMMPEPELCDDDFDEDLDWDVINEKALEKLTEIKLFKERKDVKENLVNEMAVSHNRVKRHGYHDDHDHDDDHNIVVRCKHGYTGKLNNKKNSFSNSFYALFRPFFLLSTSPVNGKFYD